MFDDYTHLNPGDPMPGIRAHTLDNREINIGPGTGKIVLVHFFILGCPHCRRSLDHLELMQESLHDNPGFLMVSVGRGHAAEELKDIAEKDHSCIRIIPDPDEKIYKAFAEKKVPRIYLFDKDGKLLQQVRGFNDAEMHEIFSNISVLLKS